jgi:hypothetical protein
VFAVLGEARRAVHLRPDSPQRRVKAWRNEVVHHNEQSGNCFGPEVGFGEIAIDLLQTRSGQLITSFEPENGQIFVDEDRLSHLGLTLRDLAHFLESQPFLFAVFTNDDVRSAASALKPATRARRHWK